jgi:putative ABC transport system substrate-binding protein
VEYARGILDFDMAFAHFAAGRVEAIATSADALFVTGPQQLIRLAAQHGVPIIYGSVEAVKAGGLMSYGASIPALFRQGGLYAGRILRSEKPADLPVIQATKFDLVINLKTAKALGLTIPETLLATAAEVIQ